MPKRNERATIVVPPVHSVPIAASLSYFDHVVWVERAIPGVGGPWMFYVDVNDEPLTPYELELPTGTTDVLLVDKLGWTGMDWGFVSRDSNRTLYWTDFGQGGRPGIGATYPIGVSPEGDQAFVVGDASHRLVHITPDLDGTDLVFIEDHEVDGAGPIRRRERTPLVVTAAMWVRDENQLVLVTEDRGIYRRDPLGSDTHVLDFPSTAQQFRISYAKQIVGCDPNGDVIVANGSCTRRARAWIPSASCTVGDSISGTEQNGELYSFGTVAVEGRPSPY